MDCFYSTQQFQNGMFIQQPNNFANSWLTCSSLPILQQFSFNIPIFQVLLSCILLINPVAPLYSFFWESVCFLPVLCLFISGYGSIHLRKQTEGKDLLMWFILWTPAAHFSLHGSPVCWDGYQWGQWVLIVLVKFVRWSKPGWKPRKLKRRHFNFLWAFHFVFILSTFFFFSFFFPQLETKHWRQVPLNGDNLVVISFGGSLGKEAQGGFLV